MDRTCSVRSEELVAYLDGYLAGGRRELVDAHARVCPSCRERIAMFREVDQLVREAVGPPRDDPVARARLRARLAAEARPRGHPRLLPRVPRGLLPRASPWVTVPLAALLLALLVLPLSSRAGWPLGDVVHVGPFRSERAAPTDGAPVVLRGVATPQVPSLEPGFRSVEPASLPQGLARAERSVPAAGRVELAYRSPTGLALHLAEVPAAGASVKVAPSPGQGTAVVGDTAVFWLGDPRPGTVSALFWERGGVFFELLVIESSAGGLPLADALAIVEAVVAAQDAPA